MVKEDLDIGLLYLGLHNQLVKKFGVDTIIERKEFYEKIGRFQHLPKSLRIYVLKEMEKKKLVKRISRDKVQILELTIDLEKNPNELFNRFLNT